MARALVALGSNLGDRENSLRAALDELRAAPDVALLSQSRLHETAPVGGPVPQAPFLNGAVLLETSLEPRSLLDRLQRIEEQSGRTRVRRWGPRTLDLDLLLYEQIVMHSTTLELPHPRMAFRRFVLEPAAEIAGSMIHPTTGWNIARLLQHLNTADSYAAIAAPAGYGKTRLAASAAQAVGGVFVEVGSNGLPARDRSSPNLALELEFLDARRRRLQREAWGVDRPWILSDFWLPQSLAYGRRLSQADQQALRNSVSQAIDSCAAPKMTVLLETPLPSGSLPSTAEVERQQVVPADRDLCVALADVSRQSATGPVLRLSGVDGSCALDELVAAIRAMQ